jgi:S1-C subfamily serine protease
MMRHFSGWTVLLVLAILFVIGLLWVRSQPPEVDNPLADAQTEINQKFGFLVDPLPGPKGGLMVKSVTPKSPAAYLGLQAGDRVLTVNERSVWQAVQLRDLMAEKLQRGPMALLVERGGVFRLVPFGAHAAGAGTGAAPARGAPPKTAPAGR